MARKPLDVDVAHKETDQIIEQIERRISKEYRTAHKEVAAKLEDYLRRYEIKDEKWRQWVKEGKKTKDQYREWRTGQIMMGKRWQEMKDTLAEDYANTAKIARSIANEYRPEVYALNHNYATYQVEHDGGIDSAYTLYDKQTVERLIREDQVLMPEPSPRKRAEIARNKDMQWNKQALQSAMTQSILQGESIPEIARRVSSTVAVKNYNSAVRYARTMYTSTENAGRYDGYRRAKDMGIDLTIEWSATLDGRTRHDHRLMHGQRTEVDKPFNLPDGHKIYYPADCTGESDAPQREIWNCRCTLLAWVKGYERDTVKSSPKMGEMTFEEWQNEKAPKKREGLTTQQVGGKIGQIAFPEKDIEATKVTIACKNSMIAYNPITYAAPRTQEEIIADIGGGDMTKGSCSSLAFAYFGNKDGYMCRDFRDGTSRSLFSRDSTIINMAKLDGVNGLVAEEYNDLVGAKKLLSNVVEGKEYYFATGKHAAVVRRTSTGLEYLELQSATDNGWHPFREKTLKNRFGAQRSHTTYGMKYKANSMLIDGDELMGNKQFLEALGFINTPAGQERKGIRGGIR